MGGSNRSGRLQLRCRRGMKELDLLLGGFVGLNKAALARGAYPEFEELLEIEDDMLWDWLQDPGLPGAAAFRNLLEQIRHGRG